ncbi:Phosphoglycerate mutase [Methylobacterium sp. 4-46]|uniref:histidine phosphatase family protein n=1 Tax=unclassified Methylobacterium TaxID=2615210 RepID=UPI000165C775|nr:MULTISPECIES: histidine phosphatase family protein [Methylobacterium]ACA15301.1 Phosphoglycerate mutase [Methylobacterium sp. 4-46]WFT81027.1 histidine phosphatase family protein [Methylobacterium nodulans]
MPQQWPARIWILRHGESAGNVARAAAHREGSTHIAIEGRDVDVPLSPDGERQAEAVGRWFAAMPRAERPNVVLTSPYRRAVETAERVRAAGGLAEDDLALVLDERLREKEFGLLDRLTPHGIRQLHPEQAEYRRLLGKFYHRPPSGESWCDVILRLRSALHTVSLYYAGDRVLLVGHQVMVLCIRYLLENLTEAEILEIDGQGSVANCAITEYAVAPGAGGRPALQRYNFVAPVARAGAPVTDAPDATGAVR